MPRSRVALAPDRMSSAQLFDRAKVLAHNAKWMQGREPRERDQLLDELITVLLELELRGTQMSLFTAE